MSSCRLITGSAGTSFKYRGFSITAEAYGRKTKIDNPGSTTFYSNTLDDMAYYVDSGYFVIPNKLEIAGRVAQIFREGPHNNSYEIDGGVNWFPTGQPNLKLMTAYTMQRYHEKQSEGSAARTQKVSNSTLQRSNSPVISSFMNIMDYVV
ncbi:MAG: hypothetical protein COV46_00975 [Deltaproteobacteria bacterium CG11_big_fil_rev_8_21_14_0_20_49_13]|nr:MAG: hypothetical protein COV46_00975 [Deltaproteobacteria bacterium CG11_big_fil_rev_8_21_14_0_20_49_13]